MKTSTAHRDSSAACRIFVVVLLALLHLSVIPVCDTHGSHVNVCLADERPVSAAAKRIRCKQDPRCIHETQCGCMPRDCTVVGNVACKSCGQTDGDEDHDNANANTYADAFHTHNDGDERSLAGGSCLLAGVYGSSTLPPRSRVRRGCGDDCQGARRKGQISACRRLQCPAFFFCLSLRGGVSTRSNGTAVSRRGLRVGTETGGGGESRAGGMSIPFSADTRTLDEKERWHQKVVAGGRGDTTSIVSGEDETGAGGGERAALTSTTEFDGASGEDEEEEEDSESDSDEGVEGPRVNKKRSKEKRHKNTLSRIARKAQMNSTYINNLEEEVVALRKTRAQDTEAIKQEERAMRESEDTSELILEGENLTKHFREDVDVEKLEEADEELESWEQNEKDEQALRLCGAWRTYKNKTDNTADIIRQLKFIRQHERVAALELKAAVKQRDDADNDDNDADIDPEEKLGYTATLEALFGEGVRAEGWLAQSRFGFERRFDLQVEAEVNDRQIAANNVMWAAATVGNATAIRRLVIKGGASASSKDLWVGNVSAVHRAASNGHTRAVRELIRLGAPVDDAETTQGRTALHMAARAGHLSTVKTLVAAGADPNKKCRRHMTVLEHAVAVMLRCQTKPVSARGRSMTHDDGSEKSDASSDSDSESVEDLLDGLGEQEREGGTFGERHFGGGRGGGTDVIARRSLNIGRNRDNQVGQESGGVEREEEVHGSEEDMLDSRDSRRERDAVAGGPGRRQRDSKMERRAKRREDRRIEQALLEVCVFFLLSCFITSMNLFFFPVRLSCLSFFHFCTYICIDKVAWWVEDGSRGRVRD